MGIFRKGFLNAEQQARLDVIMANYHTGRISDAEYMTEIGRLIWEK